jgi:hypothetical protein
MMIVASPGGAESAVTTAPESRNEVALQCGGNAVSDILKHLLADAPVVGHLTVDADGAKSVHPVPVTSADLANLVADHLAGHQRPREARTKDGRTYTVATAVGLAFPTSVRLADGRTMCRAFSFDIDVGAGHADGYSPEDGRHLLAEIAAGCEANGLPTMCVTSRSGVGYHVHVLFPRAVEARVGLVIAETIRDAIPGAEKIETFPAQAALRDDQRVGKCLALPFGGYADAPEGGRCITPAGEPAEPVFATVSEPVLEAFEDKCARLYAAQQQMAVLEAASAKFKSAQFANGDPMDYRDVGLQPVINRFAEVVDDRGFEAHIVRICCPDHGGSCFHVAPDQGWFFCHKCRHSGGGPPAPFLLLRLLRPDLTPDRVHAELRKIRAELARTATTEGAP